MLPFLQCLQHRLIITRKWLMLSAGLVLLILPRDNNGERQLRKFHQTIPSVSVLYNTAATDSIPEARPAIGMPSLPKMASILNPRLISESPQLVKTGKPFSRSGAYSNTCGDGILDPDEDCDCGTNCSSNPCCDGATCLFINGAECADGDCCSKTCKLKSHHEVCRPAKNACDLPEMCSGHVDCPPDAFKRNGDSCDEDGLGYCYNRACMSRTIQCVNVWGIHSSTAKDECYHQFNTRGVFNGHCGLVSDGSRYIPCAPSDVFCGNLHCRGGGYTPKTIVNSPAFATQILTNSTGSLIQCKSKSPEVITVSAVEESLIKDGTKCADNKVCLKGHCVSSDFIMTATDCPVRNGSVCSGHGLCTDLGTCYCDPGFGGYHCEHEDNSTLRKPFVPYEYNMLNLRRGVIKDAPSGPNENQANNALLQIVVIAVSGVVLCLVIVIMSLTCCGNHSNNGNDYGINGDPQEEGGNREAEAVTTLM
ncbi:disintegrin and metalloproteinase domain-containing protein unc-71-like isoform X2 [Paramacrobiotus metropolitanus]|uniref:disintegrin and metalloproteinase domain-containing protein unc-71-like isoform X2 n=1 Tax=Paramacrobiotus metropolitanus TaxID=2943436 RepID=UPI0024463CE3|nr:disintegrin and metalloproteinase domain-containing protein unc-71-like isoform X2 [Paramacrobiotus metropolitanus]